MNVWSMWSYEDHITVLSFRLNAEERQEVRNTMNRVDCTHFGVINGKDAWYIEPEPITIESVGIGVSGKYPMIHEKITEAIVRIPNVPEELQKGGALSCPLLMMIEEQYEGELTVKSQKHTPSEDGGTETWTLKER